MNLFDKTTYLCSKVVTQQFSTSFTLGIKTLHRRYHAPIYAIYGFVRYADEIVDTFHDYDKATLLARFKEDTYTAIHEKISLNPILHSFQQVVHRYHIENELIEAFLYSMEMDLHQKEFNQHGYDKYIYGSAEVVGLMCLRVFCEGDDSMYQQLKSPARHLGAAFQKVNFLRDVRADFEERGRTYFPGVDFNNFTESDKKSIEADIENDFDKAYQGILELPQGARSGVYLAYIYYVKLFQKIKNVPPHIILTERVRIPDMRKMYLLARSMVKISLISK
jgi:phytoene/squalene synthetase